MPSQVRILPPVPKKMPHSLERGIFFGPGGAALRSYGKVYFCQNKQAKKALVAILYLTLSNPS